jgi:signal peptidase
MQKQATSTTHKVLTVVGTVLCILLIPILLVNVTLIVKSYVNKDEVPNIGGVLPLIVLTDSMFPEIEKGDLIICHTLDASEVKEGDVISFFDPAGNGTSIVTHRVMEIINENGKLSFRTKGDGNNAEDKDPVPAENLVAAYDFRIPNAGYVAVFMQSTEGLLVCVVLPIFLLIGYDVIRRRLYEKNKKTDTDALLAELEALRAAKAAEDNSDKASEN